MNKVVIALDAGHGKYTAGKRCLKSLDRKETREWYLNNRIVEKVVDILKDYDFIKIVRTNDVTGEVDTPLRTRCTVANGSNADLFISVHHNAGANGKPAGGITVYTYTGTKHTFQKDLYNKLIMHTQLKGNRVTPCYQAGFSVLKYTHMPAVLIENGFMDSSIDVPIILSEEHATRSAYAISSFIVEYANTLL